MGNNDKYPYALSQGTILSGQYIIDRVLGQGGFGITYQATDHKSGEKVAIKEYFPDAFAGRTDKTKVTPFTGERGDSFKYGKDCFLQEAETLAKFIGNENIVRVHTYFEENGTAYFVMDFVEGTSFDRYIRDHGGRIPYEDAERILVPVMDALAAVNSKGIVHRDVTPDNIYITADGVVKLLDFGAARYSLGDRSRSLDVVLKHGFAPREQYTRHGRQGAFTDVYSLGATFYYAITGKRPPDSIDRIDEEIMPTPSSLGAKLPPQKEDAILKALSVNAADRYQTMPEFKQALFAVAKTGTIDPNVTSNINGEQIPASGIQTTQNLRSQIPGSQIPASDIPFSDYPNTGIPNSCSEDSISLMERRMMLLLESEEWTKANGYAEKILEIQPENAMAYVAKLMLANRYNVKEQLKNHKQPLENENFFNIAYRYADEELKEELDSYKNAVKHRFWEENNKNKYDNAKAMMNSGNRQYVIQARSLFESLGKWNDAATQMEKCDTILSEMNKADEFVMKNPAYMTACEGFKNANSLREYEKVKYEFSRLGNYRDSEKYIQECDNRLTTLLEKNYTEAIGLCNHPNLSNLVRAKKIFTELGLYKDSAEYLAHSDTLLNGIYKKSRLISKMIRLIIVGIFRIPTDVFSLLCVLVCVDHFNDSQDLSKDIAMFFLFAIWLLFGVFKALYCVFSFLPIMDKMEAKNPLFRWFTERNLFVQTVIRVIIQCLISVCGGILAFIVFAIIVSVCGDVPVT